MAKNPRKSHILSVDQRTPPNPTRFLGGKKTNPSAFSTTVCSSKFQPFVEALASCRLVEQLQRQPLEIRGDHAALQGE
jgi:hypothetical protein